MEFPKHLCCKNTYVELKYTKGGKAYYVEPYSCAIFSMEECPDGSFKGKAQFKGSIFSKFVPVDERTFHQNKKGI